MSKTFVYDRFDMIAGDGPGVYPEPSADGDWVKAEDAINREAVLNARIRTLEAQLNDARAELEAERQPWILIGQGLPTEPGNYLVMLEPDNEWEIRSTAPIMVEFDAFTSMPKAFTYHDGWHTEQQDITPSVTAWMRAPVGPIVDSQGGTSA